MNDAPRAGGEKREVVIPVDSIALDGDLAIPKEPKGIVLFAHGSGSSRLSRRNRFVADALCRGGLATLLFDLLIEQEEIVDSRTRHLRFDIGLLASRLVAATDWITRQPYAEGLNLGYFGASTGAAAALQAATERPNLVAAVVSRGGRPDLAAAALPNVRAATLLIVGGNDATVLELNSRALDILQVHKKLEVVPGATHLFEEPGALEEVARLARDWFLEHL